MRFEKQNLRRRNREAYELLDEVSYDDRLDEEQALEYVNHLRLFADYMGVPASQKDDYIELMSKRVSAGELKTAAEMHGGIKEAAIYGESLLEGNEDELGTQIINAATESFDENRSQQEYVITIEGNERPYLLKGDTEDEWISFDGEIQDLPR